MEELTPGVVEKENQVNNPEKVVVPDATASVAPEEEKVVTPEASVPGGEEPKSEYSTWTDEDINKFYADIKPRFERLVGTDPSTLGGAMGDVSARLQAMDDEARQKGWDRYFLGDDQPTPDEMPALNKYREDYNRLVQDYEGYSNELKGLQDEYNAVYAEDNLRAEETQRILDTDYDLNEEEKADYNALYGIATQSDEDIDAQHKGDRRERAKAYARRIAAAKAADAMVQSRFEQIDDMSGVDDRELEDIVSVVPNQADYTNPMDFAVAASRYNSALNALNERAQGAAVSKQVMADRNKAIRTSNIDKGAEPAADEKTVADAVSKNAKIYDDYIYKWRGGSLEDIMTLYEDMSAPGAATKYRLTEGQRLASLAALEQCAAQALGIGDAYTTGEYVINNWINEGDATRPFVGDHWQREKREMYFRGFTSSGTVYDATRSGQRQPHIVIGRRVGEELEKQWQDTLARYDGDRLAAMEHFNFQSATNKVMENVDEDWLTAYVLAVANEHHLPVATAEKYFESWLDREIQNAWVSHIGKIESAGEYIGMKLLCQNWITTAAAALSRWTGGTPKGYVSYYDVANMAIADWEKDSNNWVSTAVGNTGVLITDSLTGGFSLAKAAESGLVKAIGATMLDRGLLQTATRQTLTRMAASAANFGTYMTQQHLLGQGAAGQDITLGGTASALGQGVLDGAILGGVTTVVGRWADNALWRYGQDWSPKKLAFVVPTVELGKIAVEGSVFVGLDAMKEGKVTAAQVGNAFGMVVAMRGMHAGQFVRDVGERIRRNPRAYGKITPLSETMANELSQAGYTEMARLLSATEYKEIKDLVEGWKQKPAEVLQNEFKRMGDDKNVPWAVYQRAVYMMTGGQTLVMPHTDADLQDNGDGTFTVRTRTADGREIERLTFKDRVSADLAVNTLQQKGLVNTARLAQLTYMGAEGTARELAAYGSAAEKLGENWTGDMVRDSMAEWRKADAQVKELESQKRLTEEQKTQLESARQARKILDVVKEAVEGEMKSETKLNYMPEIKTRIKERYSIDIDKVLEKNLDKAGLTPEESLALGIFNEMLGKVSESRSRGESVNLDEVFPRQAEQQAAEAEKVESKVEETPKAEEPKAEETPKVEETPEAEETPKVEEPKAEQPTEEPKVEEPKAETPKVEEAPKAEEPKEEPKVEEPKEEMPKEEPKVEEPEEPVKEEKPEAEEEATDEYGEITEEDVKAVSPGDAVEAFNDPATRDQIAEGVRKTRDDAVRYSREGGEKPLHWEYWKEKLGLSEPPEGGGGGNGGGGGDTLDAIDELRTQRDEADPYEADALQADYENALKGYEDEVMMMTGDELLSELAKTRERGLADAERIVRAEMRRKGVKEGEMPQAERPKAEKPAAQPQATEPRAEKPAEAGETATEPRQGEQKEEKPAVEKPAEDDGPTGLLGSDLDYWVEHLGGAGQALHEAAKNMGLKIRLYDGGKDGARGYTENGTIWVNKTRMREPDKTDSWVIGHEMTHAMDQTGGAKGKKAYAAYKRMAMRYLRQRLGEEAVERRLKELEDLYLDDPRTGLAEMMERDPDFDLRGYLEDEMVADEAGYLLSNEAVARDMLNQAEDMGAMRMVKDAIVNWIDGLLAKAPGNWERKASLERVRDSLNMLYAQRVKEHIDGIDGVTIGEDGDHGMQRHSLTAMVEGLGFVTRVKEEDAERERGEKFDYRVMTDEEGNAVFTKDGKTYSYKNPITGKDIRNGNSVFNMMIEDALALGTVKEEQVEKICDRYADMLNTFLRIGAAEKNGGGGAKLMTENWQYIADSVYRTVATNSDAQYAKSIDITRVCKKNEAVINEISLLQTRQGYGVTPAQILDIYDKTIQYGYQAPCPVCYVFSRYIRNGRYASAAINGMSRYGNHLRNGKDPWSAERWVKEMDNLDQEAKKYANEYKEADNKVLGALTKEIDDLRERLFKEDLSASEQKKIRKEIADKSKQYERAVEIWSMANLKNWIKSFAIEKKNNQWRVREDALIPEDLNDFRNHALDLRITSATMEKYPGIQRLRKSAGAAGGKEITWPSDNKMGELWAGLGNASPGSGYTNPYMKAYYGVDELGNKLTEKQIAKARQDARQTLSKAAAYVAMQNLRGGVRMWSWSDNIERLAPDVASNLMQLEMLGGGVQTYSKQLEGIELASSMGAYVNGSLMARDNGYREVGDYRTEVVNGREVLAEPIKETITEYDKAGNPQSRERIIADVGSAVYEQDGKKYVAIFDDVIGIDPHGRVEDGKKKLGLFDLNMLYDRAGNIVVGMNDLHVKALLNDPRIFFVIPWHRSGAVNHILQEMFRMLGQTEGIMDQAVDYTSQQEEYRYVGRKRIGAATRAFWESHKNETDYACGIEGGVDSSKGTLSESQLHYRALRSLIFGGIEAGGDKPTKAQYEQAKEDIVTLNKELRKANKTDFGTEKAKEQEIQRIEGEIGKAEYIVNRYEIDLDKALEEIKADAFLSQVYEYVQKLPDKKMTSGDNKYVYPYEYWNRETDITQAKENGFRYMEYCRRLGIRPKFSGDWKKKDGSAGRSVGDFTNEDGYWKLLIDRRMYDREGKYQDITPIDSEGFRGDMIDPAKTADRFHVTEVADEEGARRVVDAVQESERERLGGTDAAVDYGWRLSEKVTGKRAKGEEIIEFPPVGGRRYSLSGEARRVLEDEASTEMQRAAARAVLNREERRESDRERISLDEVRESGATVDDGEVVRYSLIKDPDEIKRYEDEIARGEVEVRYRAMADVEGLRQPMASKENGKLRDAIPEGAFERADEIDIDSYLTDEMREQMAALDAGDKPGKVVIIPGKLIYEKQGKSSKSKGTFKFHLVKPNGKGLYAAYNPWLHSSDTPLNDQFSEAWNRPELVVVRMLIPKSALEKGNKPKYAKDDAGDMRWNSGPVDGQMAEADKRIVTLARYGKIDRPLTVDEQMDLVVPKLLKNNATVPFNCVTPREREALVARGVKIGPPEKGSGQACEAAYAEWVKGQGGEAAMESQHGEPGKRFSLPSEEMKEAKKALRESEESRKLFEATKKKFGTTKDINEAGYILPDGTMLDFSGRHWMDEGQDTSHLAGSRAVDHREISDVGYDKDENETGFKTDMSDFINRGAIRVHRSGNYSRINLSMEPTAEQMKVLRRFAAGVDNVDVDFGDGNHSDHFAEYEDAWPSRVLGDIDRYFTEGIKPSGSRRYSLNGGARRWWGEREEALRSEYDALAEQARPLRRARQEGTAYSPNELAAIDRQMRALRGKIDLVNKVNDLLDNAAEESQRTRAAREWAQNGIVDVPTLANDLGEALEAVERAETAVANATDNATKMRAKADLAKAKAQQDVAMARLEQMTDTPPEMSDFVTDEKPTRPKMPDTVTYTEGHGYDLVPEDGTEESVTLAEAALHGYLGEMNGYYSALAEWEKQMNKYEAKYGEWKDRQRERAQRIAVAQSRLRAIEEGEKWEANTGRTDAAVSQAIATGQGELDSHEVATMLQHMRYEHRRVLEHAAGEDLRILAGIEKRIREALGIGESVISKAANKSKMKQTLRDLMDMVEGTMETPDNLKEVVEMIKGYFDDLFTWQENHGLSRGRREDYVTHIWDLEKSQPDEELRAQFGDIANTRTNNPYMSKRVVKSYAEGRERGLVPKYDSILDVMRHYAKRANEAVATARYMDMLKYVKMGVDIDGERVYVPLVIEEGDPTWSQRYDAVRNSALYHNGMPKYFVLHDAKGLVQKEVGKTLGVEEEPGAVARGFDKITNIVKGSMLKWSFFHHGALTEHYLGNYSTLQGGAVRATWDVMKMLGKMLYTGKFDAAHLDPELTERAASHFVRLGVSGDYQGKEPNDILHILGDWMDKLSGDDVLAKGIGKFAKGASEVNDRLLWDVLHDGFKLMAYSELERRTLRDAKRKGWDQARINRELDECGQTVNNMFGGQHFDLLGQSKEAMRWWRRFFLSPDWNVSWPRLIGNVVGMGNLHNYGKGYLRGAHLRGEGVVARKGAGLMYARSAAVVFGIMTALNYMFRKQDEQEQYELAQRIREGYTDENGKVHEAQPDYKSPYERIPGYMSEMPTDWSNTSQVLHYWNQYLLTPWNAFNDPGKGTYLFVGRDDNGRSRYVRFGKQMREWWALLFTREGAFDPVEAITHEALNKANPMFGVLYTMGTGTSLNGWENKALKEANGFLDKSVERAKLAATLLLPMSYNGGDMSDFSWWKMMFPTSKGMSAYGIQKRMEEAMIAGDDDMVARLRNAAAMSGYQWDKIEKSARSAAGRMDEEYKALGKLDTPEDVLAKMGTTGDNAKEKLLERKWRQMMESNEAIMDINAENVADIATGAGNEKETTKRYRMLRTGADFEEDETYSKAVSAIEDSSAKGWRKLKGKFSYAKGEFTPKKENRTKEQQAYVDAHVWEMRARLLLGMYDSWAEYQKDQLTGESMHDSAIMSLIRQRRKAALRDAAKLTAGQDIDWDAARKMYKKK